MATLQTQDANILEAETINWRLIVYTVLAVLIVVGGGLGIYFYQLSQRNDAEAAARKELQSAKTPADFVQVADHFPGTTQATFALIGAADLSFAAKDFTNAEKHYRRVTNDSAVDPVLRDSAGIGLGSVFEAEKKTDDAAQAYLTVAHRGDKSPYSAYAYASAARIYDQGKNRDKERQILTEAAGLGGDSVFVKEIQSRLKSLNASAQTAGVAVPPGKPSVAPSSAPTAAPSKPTP